MRARSGLLLAVLLTSACTGVAPASPAATPTATAIPTTSPPPSASVPTVGAVAIVPILVNSEIIKGPNRFLFSLTDRENVLIAAPDVAVALEYFEVDAAPDTVAFTGDATFLWAIEGSTGLYVTTVDFPRAGRWGTRFTATFPDGRVEQVRADYDVAATGSTPALGAPAPNVDTPTLDDVAGDLAAITTDKEPLRRLYQTSIADALAAGRAFVVIFATPAFCDTRLCGPTLDTVKSVATERPEMTFINLEPYAMTFKDGSLQPEFDQQGQLQAAPWTTAWGLRSEPYTFVVADDGTIAAKFEGVLGADELRAAIDAP